MLQKSDVPKVSRKSKSLGLPTLQKQSEADLETYAYNQRKKK